MKFSILFIHLQLLVLLSQGQILNHQAPIFGETPFFNEEWISKSGIKSIHAEVSFKYDKALIVGTNLHVLYEFNKKGQLILKQESIQIKNRIDTSETHFIYDSSGRIIKVVEKDHYGYFALNYKYDSGGKLIGNSHTRETLLKNGNFVQESIVWKDSIAELTEEDFTIRRIYHNMLGKSYKEIVIKMDNAGLELAVMEMSKIGGEFSQLKYERGENGRIQSKSFVRTLNPTRLYMKRIYNEKGLLLKEEYFKNEELNEVRRLDYNEMGLLELHLLRNIEKKRMEIYQFTYSYFN